MMIVADVPPIPNAPHIAVTKSRCTYNASWTDYRLNSLQDPVVFLLQRRYAYIYDPSSSEEWTEFAFVSNKTVLLSDCISQ